MGRLVPGAFADIAVLRGRGRGTAWKRIVAATERDVALVVIGGVPRYGDTTLMKAADAPPTFAMTVGGRNRRVALPSPTDATRAWSWTDIMTALRTVQTDPQSAMEQAQARAATGPRFTDDAELELFLDMPDTRRNGRAGPPKHPELVKIPPLPTLEHDQAYFTRLKKAPIHRGMLNPLREWFI